MALTIIHSGGFRQAFGYPTASSPIDVGSGANRKAIALVTYWGSVAGTFPEPTDVSVGGQTLTLQGSVYTDGTAGQGKSGIYIGDITVTGSQTVSATFTGGSSSSGAAIVALLVVRGDAPVSVAGLLAPLYYSTGGVGGAVSRDVTTTAGAKLIHMAFAPSANQPASAVSPAALLASAITHAWFAERTAATTGANAIGVNFSSFSAGHSAAFALVETDSTPPSLTSPSATGGTATGTGGVTSSEAGTGYWQVNSSATPLTIPAAPAAMTGWTSRTLAAGAQTWSLGALSAGTYYLHQAAEDAAGNRTTTDLVTGPFTVTAPADTTPPTLTSPTATGGTLVCSGSVSTNEANGTLSVVFSGSATAPSAAQVEAGQDHTGGAALRAVSQAVNTIGAQAIASGAVTAGTRYMHAVHRDAAGNASAVVTSSAITVTAAGPTIATQPSAASVTAPAAATFSVAATASAGSLTYQWQRQPAAGGGYTAIAGATSASYITPATSVSGGSANSGDTYRVVVSDSNGSTTSTAAALTVAAAPAGFDLNSAAHAFEDNTGTPWAAAALIFAVHDDATGALVTRITGITTNGAGIVAAKVTHASLVAGTTYSISVDGPGGAIGRFRATATA